ncbi:MAG: GNAT family N-acetyltransferase [Abditibacteriales bacterium]|nr:GNAT family N-acetyltransferase [Abditibacteriales bacterium]MDW8364848.1 GNAT family N-acetyltransferase [Abditibacteriales bacterium]
MRRSNLENLPDVVPPDGYALRTYQPGDEAAWGRIMDTGIGQDWTVEKVRKELIERPQFAAEGLFFATYQGEPVGSACAWRASAEEKHTGIVHMVCVLPEHRGKRLGYVLTLQVLHWFREQGFAEAVLSTDDWRLSAIKAYLDLGFEPIYTEGEDHPKRWRVVGEKLGVALGHDVGTLAC